jgi:N-methylhydantoinase B/oxoprolinase/acetone carboxylase alpha subunit
VRIACQNDVGRHFAHYQIKAMPVRAVQLELLRHLLVSIAEEMGAVLRKSAYSANIKERRDYSCALYDARGETIAMGDHMPVHLGAMPLSVKAVREVFDLEEGDVALVNDPFQGGTHLPDITAVAPVFTGSRKPTFFVASRAHHADVGGMSPGSMPLAREIFQEGLRIPPILIRRRGRMDRDILRLILANVRTPIEREGDLAAQLASTERGEHRIKELAKKYGPAKLQAAARELQDYSARMMCAALRELPSGTYSFEDALDNDGISSEPIPIRVRVTIARDRATVDFTGSAKQALGPVNANYAVTIAATMYVFRCLIRDDVPFTAGILRPIDVIAPDGTVVNAIAPAAMAAGNVETSQRIVDVLLGALAKAAPDRIPAASCGTMNNISFGGTHRGSNWAYYETIAGGSGASTTWPGLSAHHTHMTNSWNTPVEAFEYQYPVRIERYRVRRDSGGKGKHDGGDGIERTFRFLDDAEVTLIADRRIRAPYGLSGGESGATGQDKLNGRVIPAKSRIEVRSGDLLEISTPGGGGFGRPSTSKRK